MKKVFIYFAFLVSILLFVANTSALNVKITGDKLTLHTNQDSLQSILQQFAAMGIKIRIDPQINPKISISFEGLDIQRGLDSILKPSSYVLIWESIEGSVGPITKLSEIQVFQKDKEGLMKPFGIRLPLAIVRDPKNGSFFVKNEILLKLKKGISLLEFEKLLSQIGGTVVASDVTMGIYKIHLPDDANVLSLIEQTTKHPGVSKAEPNYAYPVSIPYKNSDPIAVFTPKLPNVRIPDGTASVAILDSGLNQDIGLEQFVVASFDALNPDEPITDSLGHGTQMALIAAGIVKPYGVMADPETLSPIIPIRIFDDNGFTSNFVIMRSIDFALQNGARVVSLSWGSETRSDFLEKYLKHANSKGLIIVASVGNDPTGNPVYPAAYGSVIGVGALSPNGKSWEKSNYGDFVTLYAPGFATLPIGHKGDPGAYAGTSISAAFVANGIANYLMRNPGATLKEIFSALRDH